MTTYTETEVAAMFNEWLDSTGEPFIYGGHTYTVSDVLKAVDEAHYREELNNWMDDQELDELTDPEAPDVILYAYRSEIEEEYEARKFGAMAMAEEHDEYRGDQQYDWQVETDYWTYGGA
jgi:hypothetical protein